jgi:hypothetical protein
MRTTPKTIWALLGGIVTFAAILLAVAPAEATLGNGIKAVYLHVALTWAGMAGLMVAGLLGLGAAVANRELWYDWAYTIAWVALAFHAGGTAMSVVAGNVNWGAMFWQEPRTRVALSLLAAGAIVQVANSWLPWGRAKALLYPALVAYMIASTATTPLVLHPRNPIATSDSAAIKLTFAGLFLLAALAVALLAYYWRPGSRKPQRRPQ